MSPELTPPEHEHSALVELAARELSEMRQYPHPIIPYLAQRHGLTAKEGCEVIRLANLYKARRAA